MGLILALFLTASLVVEIAALFRNSPVRRWYTGRNNPRRAAGLSVAAWVVVFLVLTALVPTTVDEAGDRGGSDTGPQPTAPSTSEPRSPGEPPGTRSPMPTGPRTAPRTAVPTPVVPAGVPGEAQEAEVRRIVDGDTMELAAPTAGVALAGTGQVDVRLLEIDAPETGRPGEPAQCYGDQATARLTELAPPTSTVWIQRDEQLRDPYGRHLLYLWNDEGAFVNLEMVEGGHADAVLFPPNDRYWAQMSAARADAEAGGAGLWGVCASAGEPEQAPPPQPPPEPEPEPEPEAEPEPEPEAPPELEPDPPSQPGPPYQPEPRDQPEPESDGDYVVPAPPPDLDCGEIADRNFPVRPGDPHRFDADGDGIGCED